MVNYVGQHVGSLAIFGGLWGVADRPKAVRGDILDPAFRKYHITLKKDTAIVVGVASDGTHPQVSVRVESVDPVHPHGDLVELIATRHVSEIGIAKKGIRRVVMVP